MKKVLYITYDGLTDPLGQSQILPYLNYLSQKGFQFTILSFEKRDRYEREKAIVNKITGEAGIIWEPLFFTAKPPVLSKMYDRFMMMKKAKALYRNEKFDIIHCRSYVAAEVGLEFKRKFGSIFLFDMRGFWADEKVDNGQWNLKKLLARRIYQHYKKKENEFLLNADGIISLTQNAKDYLLSLPQYKNIQIDVIPCCADLDHFDYHNINQADAEKLKSSLGIKAAQKLITYLGSVGGWYMTKEMFSFFNDLSENNPEFVMLLLTKDDKEKVKAEAMQAGIAADKIIVTYANRNELPVYLAITKFSIFFIRNTFSKKASSPTKHAELMGMGIPVICNDIGDTGNIISKTKTGIVINEFNDEDFKKVLGEMPALEKMDKEYIRSCAADYFDLKLGAEKYFAVYSRMLSKK